MKHTLVLLVVAVLLALANGLRATEASAGRKPVVVFFVRHAETASATGGSADRELSSEGKARAEALAALLGKAGVTHLFASEYQRTRATLEPLSRDLELEVVEISARDAAKQLAALRELPDGAVAVVAGHSNTVPALAKGLGVELLGLEQHPTAGAVLPETAYDRVIQVVLPAGDCAEPAAVELRYRG